jgi:hypothetical protein
VGQFDGRTGVPRGKNDLFTTAMPTSAHAPPVHASFENEFSITIDGASWQQGHLFALHSPSPLAQHDILLAAPALIQLTETGVAIAVGVGLPVLLPQQLLSYVRMGLPLLVKLGEVRQWPNGWPRLWWTTEQGSLQPVLIPILSKRPRDAGSFGSWKLFRDQAERHSGIGLKLFGFIAESVFTITPESCSGSPRNSVRNHPGMAFGFDRIPHEEPIWRDRWQIAASQVEK